MQVKMNELYEGAHTTKTNIVWMHDDKHAHRAEKFPCLPPRAIKHIDYSTCKYANCGLREHAAWRQTIKSARRILPACGCVWIEVAAWLFTCSLASESRLCFNMVLASNQCPLKKAIRSNNLVFYLSLRFFKDSPVLLLLRYASQHPKQDRFCPLEIKCIFCQKYTLNIYGKERTRPSAYF